MAVLIFQCINNQAPTYLKVLLNINHNRFLRSSSSMLLPVSMSRLSIVHNSSFSIHGPRIWNELPIEVKRSSNINDFKCKLKNYMFSMILQFIISSFKFYSFYHLLLVLYVFLSVKCSRNDINQCFIVSGLLSAIEINYLYLYLYRCIRSAHHTTRSESICLTCC